MKVIFSNENIAVFEDGSYILSPSTSSGWMCPTERKPSNEEVIWKAKRAVELGLTVSIPEPTYTQKKGVAAADPETIISVEHDMRRTMHFSPTARVGKIVLETRSLHDYDCQCCACPQEMTYGHQDAMEPAFEPNDGVIPEEWLPNAPQDRKYLEVQTPDGRWLYRVLVRGSFGSGSFCDLHTARRMGCNAATMKTLETLETAWEAKWEAARRVREDKEREQLRQFFGVE